MGAGILAVALIAVVVAATAVLVAAELRGQRRLGVIAKVIASVAFVLLGLCRANLATAYDAWVLLALGLCLAGDVLLALPRGLAAGLGCFLVGHLAYAAAFSTLVPLPAWPWPVAAAMAVPSAAAAVWLWPHLGRMRIPVLAYIVVITAMAWGALSVAGHALWMVWAGALLFYLSDLAVARDRFVVCRFASRAWGLPAYYLAQVLLALTLGR
ncbi:MAG: hypothetical protein B7X11_00890 [Acidobacteria bacterium 37-65-4]|nr:MAG: hypothetical protein B7X11_00890 [Acidobacteria bacterium 37-65-4]